MRRTFDYIWVAAMLAVLAFWAIQQYRIVSNMQRQNASLDLMIEIETFRICRAVTFYPDMNEPEFCGDSE